MMKNRSFRSDAEGCFHVESKTVRINIYNNLVNRLRVCFNNLSLFKKAVLDYIPCS